MPDTKNPRHGSMQYWPRKRAKRPYARVRNHNNTSGEAKICGFAGYKVGMTHVIINDDRKTSLTKDMEITVPATIIECPPLKVIGIRFYKRDKDKAEVIHEVTTKSTDKHLKKKLRLPKNIKKNLDKIPEYDDLSMIIQTQPSLTSTGKKKPEIFEMAISGSKDEQLNYAKEKLGKEIPVTESVKAGDRLDTYVITTGKGYQGPVKRFGVAIRHHKSEKTKRGPGSICGGWKAQAHMMYRVAYAGQMGYHQRKEFNKWVLKVSDNPKEVNPKGGFVRYGNVKSNFIIVKGSVGGSKKRLVRLAPPARKNKKIPKEEPNVRYISIESKQR